MSGGHSGEAIPVPIPNTEVKLSNADDTAFVVGKQVAARLFFLFFMTLNAEKLKNHCYEVKKKHFFYFFSQNVLEKESENMIQSYHSPVSKRVKDI